MEHYGLNWIGKSHAKKMVNTLPTMRFVEDKEHNSAPINVNSSNLFIEGDNLEALKLLLKTHKNAVKMIYIDPPYNTGKKFIYADKFSYTAEDLANIYEISIDKARAKLKEFSKFELSQSAWLTFMYPRLYLARELLTDDGVIFISIDDNEQAQLKLLCDEVFGEENFVALLSVENNPKGRKNSKFISVSNDFCIIYAKNKELSKFIENIPKNVSDMRQDENGKYVHASGKRVLVGENDFNQIVTDFGSDKHYSVYFNRLDDDIILKQEKYLDEKDLNLIEQGYIRYISFLDNDFVENTYTKHKFLELFEDDTLEFSENKIYEKNFSDTIRMKSILNNKSYKAVSNGNLINYNIDVKTTSAGTLLKELFKTKLPVFSAPKNPNFLRHLITLFEDKNFMSLDFFAGSSSFPHAIMESNRLDSGNRKFIAVQYPEEIDIKSKNGKVANQFCQKHAFSAYITEISKERIRRAGKQILKNIDKNQPLDVGFKVFKLTN